MVGFLEIQGPNCHESLHLPLPKVELWRYLRCKGTFKFMVVEITNYMVPYGLRYFYGNFSWQEEDSVTHRGSRDDTSKNKSSNQTWLQSPGVKRDLNPNIFSKRCGYIHVCRQHVLTHRDSVRERRTCDMVRGNSDYAGDRMDYTRGNLSPNLQARFCKLYPADFVGWNWAIQVNSWFPKNGNHWSLYLYTMLGGFFPMDFRVKSPRAWRCRKRARPCFEKSRGGFLNKTKHKQILNARNTKTSKLQPMNRQNRACRIELADLGLEFPIVKSILLLALYKP